MMNKSKLLLVVGACLCAIGLFKIDLSNFIPNRVPVQVDNMELSEPSDEDLKKEANDIVSLMKGVGNSSKSDSKRLRDLYIDMSNLVELDEESAVIKNTDEIRSANSLAGIMLHLDMKGKYANLSKETNQVIVTSIGDESVPLSKTLRSKAVDGFRALAWAFNESSK